MTPISRQSRHVFIGYRFGHVRGEQVLPTSPVIEAGRDHFA